MVFKRNKTQFFAQNVISHHVVKNAFWLHFELSQFLKYQFVCTSNSYFSGNFLL